VVGRVVFWKNATVHFNDRNLFVWIVYGRWQVMVDKSFRADKVYSKNEEIKISV
jgi:hypothetical protein